MSVNNAVLVKEWDSLDGRHQVWDLNKMQSLVVGSNAGAITLEEFVTFCELCAARGLNPLTKEAYLIKYGSQAATMVVSKDAVLKRAVRHPMYDGKESGVIVLSAAGAVEERNGCFVAPGEQLLGGWCRVYRKDWNHPEYMSVSLEESAQRRKDGSLNGTWSEKPATMVEKVAKVRALREAFIEELAGLYDEDEMPGQSARQPRTVAEAVPDAALPRGIAAPVQAESMALPELMEKTFTSGKYRGVRISKLITNPRSIANSKAELSLVISQGDPEDAKVAKGLMNALRNHEIEWGPEAQDLEASLQ